MHSEYNRILGTLVGCAIACAITGAHEGIQSIPAEVVKRICEQNPFGFEELAEKLLSLRKSLS